MKIVVLIGKPKPELIYFANAIHQHYKIDLLVIEKPQKTKVKKKEISNTLEKSKLFFKNNFGKQKSTSYSFLEKVFRFLLFKLGKRKKVTQQNVRNNENKVYYDKLFKGLQINLNSCINTITVDNINSNYSEESIRKICPDLIIDHGTSLLKENIINLSELALNLHWGLSPYYRGVDCTKRALFNWDTQNIGVTVHKLCKNIDGGDILGQSRIELKPQDNEATITAQLTFLGTEIIKNAIDMIKLNQNLKFKKQNFVEGYLYKIANMNQELENYVNRLDEEAINKMIQNPSRGKVPIIIFEKIDLI